MLILLILCIPFFSFLLLFILQSQLKRQAAWIASLSIGLSFILVFLLQEGDISLVWFRINTQSSLNLHFRVDSLSQSMLAIVLFVSFLVHIFSVPYMKGDKDLARYFAYMGLFTFSMLGIVLSYNLLQIYIFWELVGLSSYLLIGFWYHKRTAIRASRKAFLINRVGDFGFLIGILLVFVFFGTFDLEMIQNRLDSANFVISPSHLQFTILGFCLFCGALGKSAQFPLQVWLPDAMAGPTPVSALIHAATMVAAGVFLLARVFFLLDMEVLLIITFIGTITTFIGAFSALMQKDLKKVLAYSTMSQLGYMVLGIGVGAYEASMFHLFTHAFFKAGLFLCAGAIIHSMHDLASVLKLDFDAQNMYLFGGLYKKMPFTFACFLICTMALVGLPFFSGFMSKDAILSGAWAWADVMSHDQNYVFYLVPIIAFGTVFLTAFYMARMTFLIFFGGFTLDKIFGKAKNAYDKVKPAPLLMKVPMAILAVLSLGFVFSLLSQSALNYHLKLPNIFIGNRLQQHLLEESHNLHFWTVLLSVSLAALGLTSAYMLYRADRFAVKKLTFGSKRLQSLAQSSFHLDSLYQKWLIASSLKSARSIAYVDKVILDKNLDRLAKLQVVLAHITAWFDRFFVDGAVNVIARLFGQLGQISQSFHNGKVQWYFIVVLLLVLGLAWLFAY